MMGGINWTVKEEMISGFWLTAEHTHQAIRFKLHLVCAQVASASPKPSEKS